jgi:hypothetical protein
MLETIDTVMIAAAVVILLILISLAYQPRAPSGVRPRGAARDRLGLAEFGTTRAAGGGPTGRSRSAGSVCSAARWC